MISLCSQCVIQHFSLKIALWISHAFILQKHVFGSCVIFHHNVSTIPLLWNIFTLLCVKPRKNIKEEISLLCHITASLQRKMPLSLRNCTVQRHCPPQHYRWAKLQIRSHATVVWSEGRHCPSEHSGPLVCQGRDILLWAGFAPARPWWSRELIANWFFSPGTLFSFHGV